MIVDRNSFLLMAAALAASGCDTNFGRAPAPAPAPAPAAPTVSVTGPATPIKVDVLPVAVEVACDDSQGSPEACPSVGPSDEGICPDVLLKRCGDFKLAMKPRVAAQAVSCLRSLKGNERCDLARINQCGHAALMSACPEPSRTQMGQLDPATASKPASVTLLAESSQDNSPVTAACNSILRSCGEKPLNPTLADCRQTLAGFNDVGRAAMVECVSAHCSDKGLYGCEAVPKVATAAAGGR